MEAGEISDRRYYVQGRLVTATQKLNYLVKLGEMATRVQNQLIDR